MRTDLHTPTVASDGRLDAAQLIRLAGEAGVSVLAVTDHDSTESVEAAMRSGREAGIDVVPAVELNTDVPGAEVHILGYFIDHRLEWLQGLLRRLRDGRLHRAERMVEKLTALGVPIQMERVPAFASGGAVGRPPVARALAAAGRRWDGGRPPGCGAGGDRSVLSGPHAGHGGALPGSRAALQPAGHRRHRLPRRGSGHPGAAGEPVRAARGGGSAAHPGRWAPARTRAARPSG